MCSTLPQISRTSAPFRIPSEGA